MVKAKKKNTYKPIDVDSNKIVYAAVITRGMSQVLAEMEQDANDRAAKINKKIKKVGGTFVKIWFCFDDKITEDEVKLIEE